MSCNSYVAKTFAHVAGLIGVTAVGTQISQFDTLLKKPETHVEKILHIVIPVLVLVGILFMGPGPIKYIMAGAFSFYLGLTLRAYVQSLDQQDSLQRILVTTAAISVGIIGLALLDTSGRFLKFLPILMTSLMVFLLVNLYYYFADKGAPKWLDTIGVALFSLFIAYDTQDIRAAAKTCRKPDYINQSFGLYLDILNIFGRLGD